MRNLLWAVAALPLGCGSPVFAVEGSGVSRLDAVCKQLAARVSSFDADQCRQAGLNVDRGSTVEGRPLLARDFAPASGEAAPRRILLLGGIHGDELSSVAVVFQWMERLRNDRYQHFQWRVLPFANPDGMLAQPAAHRTNAHGVDLNRNFPSPDWAGRALSYWKTRTGSDPRRYPGPQEASEPETRWIAEQIRTFKPDVIVSVHAPYGLLDFDGPRDPPKKLGYLRLQPLGVYPGSLGDYAGVSLKLPVITLELPQADVSPSATQSGRIWADLLAWLDKNIGNAK